MRKKIEVKTDKTDKNLEKLFDVKKKTTSKTKTAPKKETKTKVETKKVPTSKKRVSITKTKTVKEKVATKSTPKQKIKKTDTPKIVVGERPYPESWKEMDKIDKKIIKLTENLKAAIIEGIELIGTRLETEKDQSYQSDLKDYLTWVTNLNKETEKFYNFGK